MKSYEIFSRSFGRRDQKILKYSAFVACFVASWSLCTMFKPYIAPVPIYPVVEQTMLICDKSNVRYDTCEMNGDVRIQGNSSSIFILSSHKENASWMTIKPYARKGDESAMKSITMFTIKLIKKQEEIIPICTQIHDLPAIVFSVGGFAGNNFHAFSDVIIPLYATSRIFNGEVKFVIANKYSQWMDKFQEVIHKLSRYEAIDIDRENEVHCFKSVTVGLKKEDEKELYHESMKDFRNFLRNAYSLERAMAINLTNSPTRKSRLLIISREKTRAFTNMKDLVLSAEDIGFEVIVSEMNANMTHISRLVNSCDVMMGVHGAGLTNMVFLPENAIVIQVVPIGKMDWLANTCYGEPSKGMGLKYLEYKISEKESTLIQQYPLNHQVFMDPHSIHRKGWDAFKSVYMEKQNVTLNVTKFENTLSRALELLQP